MNASVFISKQIEDYMIAHENAVINHETSQIGALVYSFSTDTYAIQTFYEVTLITHDRAAILSAQINQQINY